MRIRRAAICSPRPRPGGPLRVRAARRALFRAAILFSWSGQIAAAASSPYAKNEIVFPNDPFEQRSQTGLDSMGWIKFTIAKEPTGLGPVTYQDSRTYLLHYDFVSRYMDPYAGISPEEFDRISLYQEGQKLILGAVISPPKGYPVTNTIQELGIQFVRHDPYTLHTAQIPATIPGGECPVLTLADLHFECNVRYDRAVPVPAYGPTPCATTTTMEDHVVLSVPYRPSSDDLLQTRKVTVGGVTVQTQFYWPPPPTGPTAGYTAPLIRWVETTLRGLTSRPILLHNSYAQTYLPGHHNFWETFLFEPRLDPGVPPEVLTELRNRGIGRIMVSTPEPGSICLDDFDDSK